MGKQDSLILLTGRIGNLSFYKSRHDGYLVRKKSSLTGDRVKSDPAFARTRENASEFARAGQAGKLLRRAFQPLLHDASDKRVTSRLTGRMVKVIKGDAANPRGQRNVTHGEAALLEGFEFNRDARLESSFATDFTASIDRLTGDMVVNVPAFSPEALVSAPDGATHFRLRAGGAALDFEANRYEVSATESADLPLSNKMQEALQLSLTVTPASAHTLFLILGIEFIQQMKNGSRVPLQNGAFNAMAIVKVDGGVSKERLTDETPLAEREETAFASTAVPTEALEEVYQFSDDAVKGFEPTTSVSHAPVANWSYSVSPFESIACSFTGNLHHAYTCTDDSPATASPVTPQETEPMTQAPSRKVSYRHAITMSPRPKTVPDKSRRPLKNIATHRPDSPGQMTTCDSQSSGEQSKPQGLRRVKKETG